MKKLNRVKAALGATEQAWGVILKQIEQNGILSAGNQRDYGISEFTRGEVTICLLWSAFQGLFMLPKSFTHFWIPQSMWTPKAILQLL